MDIFQIKAPVNLVTKQSNAMLVEHPLTISNWELIFNEDLNEISLRYDEAKANNTPYQVFQKSHAVENFLRVHKMEPPRVKGLIKEVLRSSKNFTQGTNILWDFRTRNGRYLRASHSTKNKDYLMSALDINRLLSRLPTFI